MASLNVCFFIGNLTRDPEIRHTPKGTAVADIGIAVNEVYMVGEEKKESVNFFNLTAWGRTAEIAGEYLKKGQAAHFQCRAKMDEWEDKESGKKRTAVKFTVEHLTLFPKGGGSRASDEQEEQRHAPRGNAPAKKAAPPNDPDLDPDDDIPF